MNGQLEKEYAIDVLVDEAGGYFTPPTGDSPLFSLST